MNVYDVIEFDHGQHNGCINKLLINETIQSGIQTSYLLVIK